MAYDPVADWMKNKDAWAGRGGDAASQQAWLGSENARMEAGNKQYGPTASPGNFSSYNPNSGWNWTANAPDTPSSTLGAGAGGANPMITGNPNPTTPIAGTTGVTPPPLGAGSGGAAPPTGITPPGITPPPIGGTGAIPNPITTPTSIPPPMGVTPNPNQTAAGTNPTISSPSSIAQSSAEINARKRLTSFGGVQ
jgi:hypothetical protein